MTTAVPGSRDLPREAKHGFLSRLHFHHAKPRHLNGAADPGSTTVPDDDDHKAAEAVEVKPDPVSHHRPAIKLRIITWNMHDSVPHGDLQDLLGARPSADVPLPQVDETGALPHLTPDTEHFYHLVVVGGQECPGGSRWTELLEEYLAGGTTTRPDEAPRASPAKENFFEPSSDVGTGGGRSLTTDDIALNPPRSPRSISFAQDPTHELRGDASSASIRPPIERQQSLADKTSTLHHHISTRKSPRTGPYVLVAKERLMGIYIAVFCLRTIEHLVTAHDHAKVTAGLMGGRVGNKGCAAVSLNLAGTRLLFISAHLAAHQGRVNARLENVLKIRDELSIDDFSGHRQNGHAHSHVKRDVTENFDCVWFFGDLNYRLDLSRLHADWLTLTHDWKNALEFDQLRTIMRDPNSICWQGWQEADIDFAPTYKYDLLKFERHGSVSLKHQPSLTRDRTASVKKSITIANSTSRAPSADSSLATTPVRPRSPTEVAAFSPSRASFVSQQSYDEDADLLCDHSETDEAAVPEQVKKARLRLLHMLRSRSATSLPLPHNAHSQGSDEVSADGLTGRPMVSEDDLLLRLTDQDAIFDSSKKQRVQSWCDRILFRSNMVPIEARTPRRRTSLARDLLGRSSSRSRDERDGGERRESLEGPARRRSSTLTGVVTRSSSMTIRPSRPADPHRAVSGRSERSPPTLRGRQLPMSDGDDRPSDPTAAPMSPPPQSPSTRSVSFLLGRGRSASDPSAGRDDPPAPSAGFKLTETLSLHPARPHGSGMRRRASSPRAARRDSLPFASATNFRNWWSQHFPGLTAQMSPRTPEANDVSEPILQVVGPRRGEVQCLQYTSVTDLRRMEATSDHQPLKGVYLLGIGGDEQHVLH